MVVATTSLAIRLTSTYVYNSTYVYTFEAPMINVKPAQPGLANRMAGKRWFQNLVGRRRGLREKSTLSKCQQSYGLNA